jgi:hypothetical protein
LLPYYNSANPAMPFSGLGNNGLTQNTVRKGVAVVTVKAGAAAATGSQVTPAPDAGYIGLYAVTVAFGQTTITAGNISTVATAPLINSTLHGLAPTFTVSPVVPAATLPSHALPLGQAVGRLIGVQVFVTSGTYNPTPGTTSIVAEGVGGGAAGGGAAATAGTTVSVGSGGTAGSYGKGRYTSGFAGQAVVIGASGVPVSGSNGGNGSTTSLGSLLSIPGGTGGSRAGAAAPPFMAVGSSGTAPSGANLIGSGGAPGSPGIAISTTFGVPGSGGPSAFGAGASTSASGIIGAGANGPGAGGAGAFQGISGAALSGGTGANGILVIYEYA